MTLVNRRILLQIVRYLLVTCATGAIVFIYYRLIHVNPTTVALTFLLGILFVANLLGLQYSVFMSLLAAFAFNFFFLPPVGALSIADSQNWIALLAFLIAGVSASHLSDRVRQEATEADKRRREVERLYEFSQKLMTTDSAADLLNKLPGYISSTFNNGGVAIYLSEQDQVYRSLSDTLRFSKEDLYNVFVRSETRLDKEADICTAPLLLGLQSIGAFGIAGNLPSRETIDALGGLIAIAIERSITAENLARTEASQENERLRSALVDSVTHELRTPLTAIKASITSLRSGMNLDSAAKEEMLAVIDEESDRLNRLVGQAVEMAQLDANHVRLELEARPLQEIVQRAKTQCAGMLENHPVEVRIPADIPNVLVDANWILKVMQHLLENAAKYSDEGKGIVISAEVKEPFVMVSVADQGVGIDDFDKALIFDKFYRGRNQRYRVQGTGMGLAIVKAIVEAHEGKVDVFSQKGYGSVFSFSLPIA